MLEDRVGSSTQRLEAELADRLHVGISDRQARVIPKPVRGADIRVVVLVGVRVGVRAVIETQSQLCRENISGRTGPGHRNLAPKPARFGPDQA